MCVHLACLKLVPVFKWSSLEISQPNLIYKICFDHDLNQAASMDQLVVKQAGTFYIQLPEQVNQVHNIFI